MRALIVVIAWVTAVLPAGVFAQDNGAYFDEVVAADDRTSCDETGWTASESEWAAATTEDFLFEHAACSTDLQMLMAGCFDPVYESSLAVDPTPGYHWLNCYVIPVNGGQVDFPLDPADFSLIDRDGTLYPYSPAGSAANGTSALRTQTLAPAAYPSIGTVTFEIPEGVRPPYLLMWESEVNGAASDAVWIVIDRLFERPVESP